VNLKFNFLTFGVALFFIAQNLFAIPAFPGAEGFGANAIGGRGKPVYKVTNLSGGLSAGSLDWALRQAENSGGGYVVFTVSGTILGSFKVWKNTYVAGQTSPGGIAIDGTNGSSMPLKGQGDDMIIRHLRIRGSKYDKDGVQILNSKNVILDHLSIVWYCDEALNIHASSNFTLQWSHLGDAAKCHPEGFHNLTNLIQFTSNITIHHNIYTHGAERNPRFKDIPAGGKLDFRNNIIYDYRKYDSPKVTGPGQVNIVGNFFKPGSFTHCDEGSNGELRRPISTGENGASFYVSNNRHIQGMGHNDPSSCSNGNKFCAEAGPPCLVRALRSDDSVDEWAVAGPAGSFGLPPFSPSPGAVSKLDIPVVAPPVVTQNPDSAYETVLKHFGPFPRDNTDLRLEDEVRNGKGGWRANRVNDNNTYSGTAPADTDNDGMADQWEQSNGGDLLPNGHNLHAEYDNIEVYINMIADSIVGRAPVDIESNRQLKIASKGPLSVGSKNPFEKKIKLDFYVEKTSKIQFKIYNIHGKLVKQLFSANGVKGTQSVQWLGKNENGLPVKNGMYFARLKVGKKVFSKTLVLMR